MHVSQFLRSVAIRCTPTALYPLARTIVRSPLAVFLEQRLGIGFFAPQWNTITQGPFAGITMYYDPTATFWSTEVSDGVHDDAVFAFVSKQRLRGKTVFDIGAHIGFNALCYAKLVGPKGSVVAFEPNTVNQVRMRENFTHNPALAARIHISPLAIAARNGTAEFLFSTAIEDGTSSGSVLKTIKNDSQTKQYEQEFKFKTTRVKTQTLDTYVNNTGIIPDLVKIDVEGAEDLVLQGATTLMATRKPLFLIELHTIIASHSVTALLSKYGYTYTVLHTEADGRVFIAAK